MSHQTQDDGTPGTPTSKTPKVEKKSASIWVCLVQTPNQRRKQKHLYLDIQPSEKYLSSTLSTGDGNFVLDENLRHPNPHL
jgi:hypothetical protein